jgi:SOS-response transcriptional repressor LexA
MTAEELAALVGTKKTQLGKLERGERRLSDHWARLIAPHLGVEPYELYMPEGISTRMRFVPLIGIVSCGNWREAVQHVTDRVPTFRAGENLFALRPEGDSMNQVIRGHGYIVVDPDDVDLIDSRFYVVMNEAGEATAKQFRANPARLEPASDNPDHRAIFLGREPFTVVGRIVEETSSVE